MERALILAAGRGSRMGLHTKKKPKCLMELAGRPLIEWQIDALRKSGIGRIEIVAGYKSEMIVPYTLHTYLNENWASTNMVNSLLCAPSYEGDTIVSYSDIAFHPSHVEKLLKSPHDIVITADREWLKLWSLRFADPLDDAESFVCNGNKLISIGAKTSCLSNIDAQFMGLLKISEAGWEKINKNFRSLSYSEQANLDMTSLLNLLLSRGEEVQIEFVNGKWCECDSYEDVLIYEENIEKDMFWIHDWRFK